MKLICDLSLTSAPHRPPGAGAPWGTPWNSPLSGTPASLVLDYAADAYGLNGSPSALAAIWAFARASDATHVSDTGALQLVGPNVERIEHDPATLARLGLLLEESRTNLFVQSDAPADQTISVAAVPHVLSFYGTGSITLSGAHVATLSGNGAFPARTELSFTPTAGALTLTLTGNVQFPQLEEGSIASSYVPSTGAPATRAAETATLGLGSWFNSQQGTLVFSGAMNDAKANDRMIEIDSGAASTRLSILWNANLGKPQFQVWDSGSLQAAIAPTGGAIPLGTPFRVAIGYALNDFAVSLNGGAVVKDTSGTPPAGLNTMRLGRSSGGAQGLMLTESVIYYPTRLSDAEIAALSS